MIHIIIYFTTANKMICYHVGYFFDRLCVFYYLQYITTLNVIFSVALLGELAFE